MPHVKALALATAIALAAQAGFADGEAPNAMQREAIIASAPPPDGFINSGYVVLGLLAALVVATGTF